MGRKPEGKAEKAFKRIGKKIDELLADLKEAGSHAEGEYSDRIEELKKSGNKLKDEFSNFKEKHQDRIDEVETNLRRAGDDLKSAFNSAFKKEK